MEDGQAETVRYPHNLAFSASAILVTLAAFEAAVGELISQLRLARIDRRALDLSRTQWSTLCERIEEESFLRQPFLDRVKELCALAHTAPMDTGGQEYQWVSFGIQVRNLLAHYAPFDVVLPSSHEPIQLSKLEQRYLSLIKEKPPAKGPTVFPNRVLSHEFCMSLLEHSERWMREFFGRFPDYEPFVYPTQPSGSYLEDGP
jgi:hypothetical protein